MIAAPSEKTEQKAEPGPEAKIRKKATSDLDLALFNLARNDLEKAQVAALIQQGADIKETTRLGTILLHYAVFYEAGIKTIEILTKWGVDVGAKNSKNKSALDMVIEKDQRDYIELLISKDRWKQVDYFPVPF